MMCIRVGNAFVETRGRHFGKVERPWGWCVAEVVYLLLCGQICSSLLLVVPFFRNNNSSVLLVL